MRALPWHVAVRADRRAIVTAVGTALCVAFSLLSFAVAEGLDRSTVSIGEHLEAPPWLVHRSDFSTFDPASVDVEGATAVRLVPGALEGGTRVTLAWLEGPLAPAVASGHALVGDAALARAETLAIAEPATMRLQLDGVVDAQIIGRGWVVVSPAEAAQLDAPEGANYLVVHELPAAQAEALRREGFVVARAPALETFFQHSAREVAKDLALVVVFSTVLVALFAYEFMRSEIRDKRREIGLWRAIGLHSGNVLTLLMARAGVIALTGTALGIAVAVAALGAAARATGLALFAPQLSPAVGLLLVAAFLGSALGGAAIAARAVTRHTVRQAMEAAA